MTLEEAHNFIESLKNETTKKNEIKIYDKFLDILGKLKIRDFTKDEIQSIETALDTYDLKSNHEKNSRFFKKTLINFEKFLKDTFSLTSKDYYVKLGGGLGMSFGILFGVVFLSSWERTLGISIGMIFGMVVGALIGRSLDAKAINEGRVL